MSDQLTPITINFHGQKLILIEKDGVLYVAMKPIVEGMGLDWKTQHRRLTNYREKFNYGHMTIVASDGKQRKMLCLPLKKLNGWLFSINANKVKPEIQDKVIQYQEECFVVLYDYWHKGAAVNPRIGLTPAQQRQIQKLVSEKVYAQYNEKDYRTGFNKIYGSIKNHFQVGSYKDVPSDRFDELLIFLGGDPSKPMPEQGTPKDTDLDRAHLAIDMFETVERIFDQILKVEEVCNSTSIQLSRVLSTAAILSPEEFAQAKKIRRLEKRQEA